MINFRIITKNHAFFLLSKKKRMNKRWLSSYGVQIVDEILKQNFLNIILH